MHCLGAKCVKNYLLSKIEIVSLLAGGLKMILVFHTLFVKPGGVLDD